MSDVGTMIAICAACLAEVDLALVTEQTPNCPVCGATPEERQNTARTLTEGSYWVDTENGSSKGGFAIGSFDESEPESH